MAVKRSALPTIFTYHEVLTGARLSRYSVSVEQLTSHLALFSGFSRDPSCAPLISFDDGHRSNYEHAMPALASSSIKATFFLTAGHISVKPDFMDWPAVRALKDEGHAIQAHGWSHRFLHQCSDKDLVVELSYARQVLEDRIGSPVHELSLPGGRYDERVLHFISAAGYRRVYTSDPWTYRRFDASLELVGRMMVRREMTLNRIQSLAEQTLAVRSLVYTEQALRRTARSLLGNNVYHMLWSNLSGRGAAPTSLTENHD